MYQHETDIDVLSGPTEEEKKAVRILLAYLTSRPEERNDAFLMLDSEYIEDQLQQRVYRAIMERPVAVGKQDVFADELEQTLLARGDYEAAHYVRGLAIQDKPCSRKAFMQLVLLIRDQASPRKAYAAEMQLLNDSSADCGDYDQEW